jgi:hypothetical protein
MTNEKSKESRVVQVYLYESHLGGGDGGEVFREAGA